MSKEEAFDKIANICEGTIYHFEIDDALDLLYEIKTIIGKVNNND